MALVKLFSPRPWQVPMIRLSCDHDRLNLLARMGMGKSSAVLRAIDALILAENVKPIVFAPLRVARSTWPEEGQKWEEFAHLKIQAITGTLEQRKAALRNDKADIYTVNYDVVPWLVDYLGESWPFTMGVADEATRVKSFRIKQGGARAQALSKVAHTKMRRWINLTGTFAPNGLADIWGPTWFVDQGQRLERTFDAFQSRWFGFQRARDAVHAHKTRIQRIAFPHAEAEITKLIADVSFAFNPREWFNIKDPIVIPVMVDLPPAARVKYREMERDMFTELKGYDIEAFAAAGKVIKCLQLANGAIYTGSDQEVERGVSHWVESHDEKLQALESIIEEAQGTPVLVAYHFKPDLVRLKKRFPTGRHINTKQDEDDFKAGLIPVAFVHAQSIGHGVDGFQLVTNIIVFFALWWDLETHDQIIERIGPMRQMQAGLDREVLVYMILARDTIDEMVADRLVQKRGLQDATMDTLSFKREKA